MFCGNVSLEGVSLLSFFFKLYLLIPKLLIPLLLLLPSLLLYEYLYTTRHTYTLETVGVSKVS